MMKAYNRVEWYYLEAIMRKLGFSTRFVRLAMKCVSSVIFSVRVNGELLPFFTPSKGLIQGDPISPYLFLLCAEGFSSLLKSYGGGGYVDRGIRVSYKSPWVSHLLFTDDSLIFISSKTQSVVRLNEILNIYAALSGQCVNQDKSAIYFNTNTPQPVRLALKQCLDIHVDAFTERYLRLPTAVGLPVEHLIILERELEVKYKDGPKSCLIVLGSKFC